MKIIILGAGEVGYNLAEILSVEGHDLSVIDNNPNVVDRISSTLDVLAINTICVNREALKNAGIEMADMVIAVTKIDEINLAACLLAKDFGVALTIARVRGVGTEYFPYDKFGVDIIIHPEKAAAKEIVRLAISKSSEAIIIREFADSQIQLVRINIRKNSILSGIKLSEISNIAENKSLLVISVIRKKNTFIPKGDFVIKEYDKVYMILSESAKGYIFEKFGIEQIEPKSAIIYSGNEIGYEVANILETKLSFVKIIEKSFSRCNLLAEKLSTSLVLRGDGTDLKLLKQENIKNTDIHISVSDDDKANLFASLLAKKLGIKNTITVIREPEYIPLLCDLGLDNIINPVICVANEILSHVREGKILSVTTLTDTESEIIEQEIENECMLTSGSIKDLRLPKNILIGAVIKNNNIAFIPKGSDKLEVGDRITVFSTSNALAKVENLFK